MASIVRKISLVLVLVVMLWDGTKAQSGCTTALVSLSPCLNYVSGNSSIPSSSCCSQLSSVVQSRPQCLCSLMNGGASSLGITINQTLALALPSVCNVQTPPASRCNDANGGTTSAANPASSPAESPVDSSDETPDVPTTPSDSDIPSAQSGCTKTLMVLYPCLNYVNGNSSTPSSSCCSQLSSVVKSQPQCLCALLNGDASSYGVNINQTLALALPGACNVQTPPVSRCKEGNAPLTPAESPADSSKTPENPSMPSVPTIPSGSKIVPSTDGTFNGGSNINAPYGLAGGAMGQSNCTSTLMTLSSCLSYVTGNLSTPSSSCCSSLGNVVQSQPLCLCSLLNSAGLSYGLNINQTLALGLPGACSVQTPPISQCKAVANGPAISPSPSPISSPADGSDEPAKSPTTTTIPSVPQGTGSKTVPKTSGSTSDRNIIKSPIHLAAVALFVVAWAATGLNF
ncbi:Bifunctional inhibitor/lipid-transfer protein/seed storage 2S albumin superfamily protein [Abeliophyllum distichum]|uniref:Bifunctional inhibitor/lipid-transfer protein/seed storage 2S albumin superfamily protein n=1 Tax=Abeliophyllum distichum TaxID=126358 RepID=A0ABD1TD92_9LAMI